MALPSAFKKGLEAAIEKRRQHGQLVLPSPSEHSTAIDLGSNDSLSLISSGALREETLRELERNPGFSVGAGGSRVLEPAEDAAQLEKFLADLHGAPDGLFFNSGFEANVAIFSTLPQTGDAIIHDDLIHASIHDGMKGSRASIIKPFAHNDPIALRRVLEQVKDISPAIRTGQSTVFITIETVYSMDGDIAPVQEIVKEAKGAFPSGNFVLAVDEAHSNGLVGPKGAGYISHLGLEKEFAIRLNTCGKALGAVGAIILCDTLVKKMLVNYARNFIFTTGPSFPMLATVKAAYNILASQDGDDRRHRLQQNIRFFYERLYQEPEWQTIRQEGNLKVHTPEKWTAESFLSPAIALVTKEGMCDELRKGLEKKGFLARPVRFPIVPKDGERIRLVIQSDTTPEQILSLVKAVVGWGIQPTG